MYLPHMSFLTTENPGILHPEMGFLGSPPSSDRSERSSKAE